MPEFPAERFDEQGTEVEYQVLTKHLNEYVRALRAYENPVQARLSLDTIIVYLECIHVPGAKDVP